jgi:hypothetical protein
MDRNHVVNSVITIVATVTFTELVRAIVSFAKKKAVTDTTRQKAKKIFSATNLATATQLIWAGFLFSLLNHIMHDTSPITRSAILAICILTIALLGTASALSFSVSALILELRRSKKRDAVPPIDVPTSLPPTL